MSKTRVSDEWVVGATVGAYAVLTFVLYFWGTAFMHFWCGNSYESVFTKDGRAPGSLAFLIPGALVGVMDWGQIKVARQGALRERAMRAALWMNLVGILGFLIAYSSNYGPDRDSAFFAIVSLVAVAFWPLGLVISTGNLVWTGVQWVRATHARTLNSRSAYR